jgi:hypothetical protein
MTPKQAGCPGMDPLELSFMSGVDTQGLLPFARAADLRAADLRAADLRAAGNGAKR